MSACQSVETRNLATAAAAAAAAAHPGNRRIQQYYIESSRLSRCRRLYVCVCQSSQAESIVVHSLTLRFLILPLHHHHQQLLTIDTTNEILAIDAIRPISPSRAPNPGVFGDPIFFLPSLFNLSLGRLAQPTRRVIVPNKQLTLAQRNPLNRRKSLFSHVDADNARPSGFSFSGPLD